MIQDPVLQSLKDAAVVAVYLRALRAPFPDLAFVPTGAVNPANVAEWLDSGAVAVGAGGELCSAADIAAGRFIDIEDRARQFAKAVLEWRQL